MLFADTGFWIGLLQPRDALSRRCVQWWDSAARPIVTTEYVMIETLGRLADVRLRGEAVRLYDAVVELDDIVYLPASPARFAVGLKLYRSRPDKAWSLTDCISFGVMREHRITEALAYDRHFEQAGFRALLREEPA